MCFLRKEPIDQKQYAWRGAAGVCRGFYADNMANQSLDFPNRVRVISVYLEKIEVQSIVITVNSIKKTIIVG